MNSKRLKLGTTLMLVAILFDFISAISNISFILISNNIVVTYFSYLALSSIACYFLVSVATYFCKNEDPVYKIAHILSLFALLFVAVGASMFYIPKDAVSPVVLNVFSYSGPTLLILAYLCEFNALFSFFTASADVSKHNDSSLKNKWYRLKWLFTLIFLLDLVLDILINYIIVDPIPVLILVIVYLLLVITAEAIEIYLIASFRKHL